MEKYSQQLAEVSLGKNDMAQQKATLYMFSSNFSCIKGQSLIACLNLVFAGENISAQNNAEKDRGRRAERQTDRQTDRHAHTEQSITGCKAIRRLWIQHPRDLEAYIRDTLHTRALLL